ARGARAVGESGVSGARRESLGSASTPICDEGAVSDARRLIDDGNHLDFDELLRLAKLKHGDVGRGRLVIEPRKIGVDYRAGLADVAHAWPCTKHKVVYDVLERSARGVQRLLDSVHCCARLRFQIVDHVLLDLVTLVRMIMVDRQRRRAGEPKKLAA